MIFEKLRDFEDPVSWIGVIESRNVQLHTVQWIVRWCLSCRLRRWHLRLLLIHFELRHSVEEIIDL